MHKPLWEPEGDEWRVAFAEGNGATVSLGVSDCKLMFLIVPATYRAFEQAGVFSFAEVRPKDSRLYYVGGVMMERGNKVAACLFTIEPAPAKIIRARRRYSCRFAKCFFSNASP